MNHLYDITGVASTLIAAGFDVRENFSLAPLTTYAVGGAAAVAVVVEDIGRCSDIARSIAPLPQIPVAIIGRGSNTLVADQGFNGLAIVVQSAPRDTPLVLHGDELVAPASVTMPVLARRSVALGRGGLEWCVGIPGSVGGAVRMNAGGHGAEMVDSLVSAEVLSFASGVMKHIPAGELGLHFRGSALSEHHLVMSARFSTTDIAVESGQKMLDDIVRWRREHQPGGRNAGSVFVNPAPGEGSAGAVIDSLGLRGFRSGGAYVSDKHANFIQAEPDACAQDVIDVMTHVQAEVLHHTGTTLRSEVCLVGFPREIAERFADPGHHDDEKMRARVHLRSLLGESI